MQEIIDELMYVYKERCKNGRITEPKAKAIIENYCAKVQAQDASSKLLNSLMILKLLIASGDDMPYDVDSAGEFQKAYRSWGVIYSRSLGSYDSVMWNLMHLDRLIWEVLEEEGIV
ncbi:hypothetical protein ADS69_00158 [Enterobacter phage phiEap-3]|uniref:Uncharacterized protein n=1 Tax=Enterobacter phage phiEap-3 TaxID=1682394 RepID=A0A0K2FHN2_9CAUD|nr:hypothetical protein FDI05_gp158 [Enterobacter phage phiEap-3]ALA45263.1 hypothetical protein ADS69_00158 [Enterobacter phage phiEap-3]